MSFTIRGEMTVNTLHVTLTDGREVILRPDGELRVIAAGSDSNEYFLDLPPVDEVTALCDSDPARNADEHGEVKITAYHRH